ncbi:response regulator [Haematobacter massiliensis]|uniref:Transcriptional regulator n=2 Tax=Haematobacter TaxID=366614 RepID=A0A086XSR8_9RHOB|nr:MULTISPECIES: response regulator [Haematobacter]KFI25068.1 transcriptional regulator [Haematobacter massiliensis]OWJ69487.1 response regulator [Haematobacter massiliensis]OWJ74271.1 response regulator [Haematobacter genomosp. 1]OWJ82217.1 response regulator [Haematobacter massiliensis]
MSDPTVLVVEDELLLRMAALAMLEDAGYDAVSAVSAEAALRIMETCPSIRVIFTDVDLGRGQDGLWLVSKVREGWPPVGVIVTSGHRHVTRELLPNGAAFIGKPYLEEKVLEEVRRLAA